MRLGRSGRATAAPAPLLCRWDLDKTYLRSDFDTLRQLWRTARERGEDKVEVPGVPELMKGLRAAADRRGRQLLTYFISASPPQIGRAVRDKLALDGVPYDGIVFKDQLRHLARGKFRHLREHVGFKLTELLRGRLAAPPGAHELLFGDDWESDALTYSLYADAVAGVLPAKRLGELLRRIGADPVVVPEILALAARVATGPVVERIFINLERRTPPAAFHFFGTRLVPTFNYFQTALVLAADGHLQADHLAAVTRALVERSGYSPRRLENSLGDLVRRGILPAEAAEALARPLSAAALLPRSARRGWLRRVLARLGRRRTFRRRMQRPTSTTPLDYDAILNRLRPAGAAGEEARPA